MDATDKKLPYDFVILFDPKDTMQKEFTDPSEKECSFFLTCRGKRPSQGRFLSDTSYISNTSPLQGGS